VIRWARGSDVGIAAEALHHRSTEGRTTMITPGIDHIALTVPDLDEQVNRLTSEFGMVVEGRTDFFAVVTDPATGLKLELGRSDDAQVHFRHLGFRADDVDGAHESLVAAGMTTSEAPHRRDFASMYTSYLTQHGGLEVQLVKYDE
jgi:catechol 2,3-dioxygenase-like lactoylglutathione lyase family enzyme